jgi:hypothetical protein
MTSRSDDPRRRVWAGGRTQKISSAPGIRRVTVEEVVGASCHHAARTARDHPYLARQLSDGEIWTAHGGVNPCDLVVRRGDRELRT